MAVCSYGLSSLDIGIRVYALTQDWNECHAIREDIFLRIKDIDRESGSDFAFPSQTLYMASDKDLDFERSENAIGSHHPRLTLFRESLCSPGPYQYVNLRLVLA